MKRNIIFILVFILVLFNNISSFADTKDNIYKSRNNLFSVSIPQNLKGTYDVVRKKDKISIYHKESKKAGFGGFAFGIGAYKDPSDHANLPGGTKIGELINKKGEVFDVVLKYPTDVQYDYTKSSNAPNDYKALYDLGKSVNIQGLNDAIYYKNQGIKGRELYNNILAKHVRAINEKWDSKRLEKEDMSYMYNVLANSKGNVLDKIGYAFYDTNADGIEELFIGEIAKGNLKGVVYDIYTMVDRKPKHVASGGNRNRYYVCNNAFICNEYSGGANEYGVRVYALTENSTELFPQVNFKYDGYENSKNPWFFSYSDNNWQNVSKEKYNERKKVFEQYERFNYIPLREFSKNNNVLEDRYNSKKDYFDYSIVLSEFPKNYFYTTVKINKSKERILLITDKVNQDKNSFRALFYYFAKNGFVYPLGLLESTKPLSQSKNYLYLTDKNEITKFYMSDKKLEIIKSKVSKIKEDIDNIKFETIKSADKFSGDFGEIAGDDVVKIKTDGFYFEYHKSQYEKQHIKSLMNECIKDGVKTQVQMYCCMVKKLHP